MPGLSFYDKQHIQKIAAQQAVIANIFNQFILSVSPYLRKWSDAGKNNVWIRNQRIENAVDRELLNLESMLYANISAFQKDGWDRAERKNDDFISQFIKGMSISSATKDGMFAHSLSAFETLKNDIDANGFKLSDRVWNITQQTKSQLEFYLDSGVVSGRNANGISSDIRQILQNPQKRFRRIRNEKGELVLSQPMKNYHPGQGVYRSAYKNALRTSATTTNIAYRSADYERWSKQDFILGIEIHRSGNNRGPCKICDAMVGKYPKTFKFTGFHPFCICFATPITMEPEDFADFLLNDTVPQGQTITDIPQAAKDFVSENKDGLQSAFWYKENFTNDGGLQREIVSQPITNEVIKVSKRIKTDAEKNDIQKRWEDRFVRNFNQAKIEQKIGVKKGKEMTFEEANELRGNINYGKASEYSVNCQSCVVANELRRRGYNVTALPNLQKTGNIPYELSMRTNWAWIDPKTMVMPKKQTAGGIYDITRSGALKSKSIKEVTKELVELVKEPGRYHIDFAWKGKNSGHIITLEKLHNGKIIIYDPQTGKMKNWRELSKEISLRY